jgi:hypothetical protein
MRSILLAVPVLLAAMPAARQTLPDGLYDCWIGNMNLGQIAIQDSAYSGPAFDGNFEGAYPLTVDGPTITWGGPLGGISATGPVVSTVVKGQEDGSVSGFDIMIQNSESGNFQTITCYAPG